MNTKESIRQQISSCADGELDRAALDHALNALHNEDARADWELYHRIGDLLRSDDMDVPMRADFSARVMASLDSEPVYLVPAVASAERLRRPGLRSVRTLAAAAAVATFAFVATPALMEALQGPAGAPEMAAVPAAGSPESVVAVGASEEIMLRDARIDEYLIAHQRFSPSVYSSAQYARSATFNGK